MASAEAEVLLASGDFDFQPGSVSSEASAESPDRTVTFVSYQRRGDGVSCRTQIVNGAVDSLARCDPDGFGNGKAFGPMNGELGGEWHEIVFQLTPAVARIELEVADGSMYEIVPYAGLGYARWPASQGATWTAQAFDVNGALIERNNG